MIHLRGVETSDLDALFALDRESFRAGIAYSRSDLRYYVGHPSSISIAAEDDETKSIVAFIIAESYVEDGRRIGHIITIDVAPASRRRGLGRTLMEAILDRLRALGARSVRLEVAVDNPEAQSFYRELGFSPTGRIRRYYLRTLDALLMEKHLSS